MKDLNECTFTGGLFRDVETRDFANGKLAKFTLLNSDSYEKSDGEVVELKNFLDCIAWNDKADEVVALGLGKGSQVKVRTKVKTESWEDKNTGQKRSKLVFTVFEVELVDGKKKTDTKPTAGRGRPSGKTNKAKQEETESENNDDVPF